MDVPQDRQAGKVLATRNSERHSSRRLKSPPPKAAMNRAHSRRPPRPASRSLQPGPAGTASFQTRSWIGGEGPHPSTAALIAGEKRIRTAEARGFRTITPSRGLLPTRLRTLLVQPRRGTPVPHPAHAGHSRFAGASHLRRHSRTVQTGSGERPPGLPDKTNRIRRKAAGTPGQGKPDPGKNRRDSRVRQTGTGKDRPGIPAAISGHRRTGLSGKPGAPGGQPDRPRRAPPSS